MPLFRQSPPPGFAKVTAHENKKTAMRNRYYGMLLLLMFFLCGQRIWSTFLVRMTKTKTKSSVAQVHKNSTMSSPCIDDDPETRETFQNDTSSRRDSPPPCDNVPELVLNLSVTLPWEINALRRTLALGDAPCFEQHFDLFAHAFAIRTTKLCKILHLHIPKTGGTSLCSLAKENSLSTPGSFCWRDGFCPLWCGCSNLSPTTCQQIHQMQQELIMNENYLDYPLCGEERLYSVALREPVSRAMSHVNHFMDAVASRGHDHFGNTIGWRLNLIQSNYMVWSFAAGRYSDTDDPRSLSPGKSDLTHAKAALRQLDFILDLGTAAQSNECRSVILEFMGMNATNTPREENSYGDSYKASYRSLNYEMMNGLDRQFYRYALDLMRVDCDFLLRLEGRADIPV